MFQNLLRLPQFQHGATLVPDIIVSLEIIGYKSYYIHSFVRPSSRGLAHYVIRLFQPELLFRLISPSVRLRNLLL